MAAKEPVLLTVLVETGMFRWYVAGVDLDGAAIPLMRSETGNLDSYLGVSLDEQVSFLRHRFSGVLQRGCDRLWARENKTCQIVFIADGSFVQADPELARRIGEHFVAWMTKPPVVFFVSRNGFACEGPIALDLVAGDIDPAFRKALDAGLPSLFAAAAQPDAWELAPAKRAGLD